jgi:vancomycin permeability regulator SanA
LKRFRIRLSPLVRRFLVFLVVIMAIGVLSPFALRWLVVTETRPDIYTLDTAPTRPSALVLGAGLWTDGTPSPVLRSRIDAAITLYQTSRVERLIMSGDANAPEGDETAVMRQLALDAGVPDRAIVVDGLGVRTYDSCYRARHVYGETEVIVVTQGFHQPRSLYLCTGIGLNAVGVVTSEESLPLPLQAEWELREVFATVLVWWEIQRSTSRSS